MIIKFRSQLVRQYVITALVNIGSLTTGLSMSWPSPMLVKLSNGTDTPLSAPITEEAESWIVSGGYLAAMGISEDNTTTSPRRSHSGVPRKLLHVFHAMVLPCSQLINENPEWVSKNSSNLLAGILIDKIGRKYCIILVSIPRICVSIWLIYVTEVWMVIFCRAVMVLSDCYIFVVVPVYVSEIASKEHRGALGTFLHVLSCLGIVMTLSIGPFISYKNFNTLIAALVVVAALPLPFLPDSPVYLHSKGRIDDAISILSKVRDSDKIIKQELEEYKASKEIKIDKIALLKNKAFLKSLGLGILLCGGANAIGYNAVSFYLQTILESSNTNVQPELASVGVGCVQLFAAVCISIFARYFGRRTMLIYPMIGLFISMIGLGIFFTLSAKEGYVISGFLNYVPLICLVLSTYCFNVGIGCLLLVVTVEFFEGPARAFGYSISFLSYLLLLFLTSKYFAQMTSALGPAQTYWFFSAMCIIVGTLIALYVPETKGKTFSEIQIAMGNKSVSTEDKEKGEEKQDG